MKISNNALNFLLAQYRAIFKRAYVKGIASAVILTAGLAVGQAQAASGDPTSEWWYNTADSKWHSQTQGANNIDLSAAGDVITDNPSLIDPDNPPKDPANTTVSSGHNLNISNASGDHVISVGGNAFGSYIDIQSTNGFNLSADRNVVNIGNSGSVAMNATGAHAITATGTTGSISLTNNAVNISGGADGATVGQGAFGAYIEMNGQGDALATGNSVSLGGLVTLGATDDGDITGARVKTAKGNAEASDNHVTINGTLTLGKSDKGSNFFGARIDAVGGSALASDNSVTIETDSLALSAKSLEIYGASAYGTADTTQVLGNQVTISGTAEQALAFDKTTTITGGRATNKESGSGAAYLESAQNIVELTNFAVNDTTGTVNIVGGSALNTGDRSDSNKGVKAEASASANQISLTKTTLSGQTGLQIVGNYAQAQAKDTAGTSYLAGQNVVVDGADSEYSVKIAGGTFNSAVNAAGTGHATSIIAGGIAETYNGTATARNNTVTIDSDATFTGMHIVGGEARTSSGSVANLTVAGNQVALTDANVQDIATSGAGIEIVGGYAAITSSVSADKASVANSNNSVTISATETDGARSSTTANIFGANTAVGKAQTTGSTLTSNANSVTIEGDSTVDGNVYGATVNFSEKYADDAKVQATMTGNTVTFGGKTAVVDAASPELVAAHIKTASDNSGSLTLGLTDNIVALTSTSELTNADIYAVKLEAETASTKDGENARSLTHSGNKAIVDGLYTINDTNAHEVSADIVEVKDTAIIRIQDGELNFGGLKNTDDKYFNGTGTVAAGAKIANADKVNVFNALTVAGDDSLIATSEGALLSVNAGNAVADGVDKSPVTEQKATLTISQAGVQNYLQGDGSKITLKQGMDVTDRKGALQVTSGGTLEFTDQSVVLSNFDFVKGAAAAAQAGKILVDADASNNGSIFKANELTVEHAFASNATTYQGKHEDLQSIEDNGIILQANTLNLGAAGLNSSESAQIDFDHALVKENINFLAATSGEDTGTATTGDLNTGYYLTTHVIGSNFMKTNDQNSKLDYYTALDGNVNGQVKIVSGGILDIRDGHWTAHDQITVASGGKLVVGGTSEANADAVANGIESLPDATLTTSGVVLDVTIAGDATVQADGNGHRSWVEAGDNRDVILDLTSGLTMQGDTSGQNEAINGKATIDATNAGVVRLDATDVNTILGQNHRATSNTSGAFFTASNSGVLQVDGEVNAAFGDFDGKDETNGFNLADTGILEVTTLNVENANVEPAAGSSYQEDAAYITSSAPIEFKGTVRADDVLLNDLQLTVKSGGSTSYASQVKFGSGTLEVAKSLSSVNDTVVFGNASGDANLTLKSAVVGDEGTVDVNTLRVDSGSIWVKNGEWTAQNITLSGSGAIMTVGGDDGVDHNGNDTEASLTFNHLTMGQGSEFSVEADGTATVNTADFSGLNAVGAVSVAGVLNINGANVSGDATNDVHFSTTEGAIRIENNGSLRFGNLATTGAILADDDYTGTSITLNSGFTKIANNGGELYLDFDSGSSFDDEAIIAFKHALFTADSFADGMLKNGGILNIGAASFEGFNITERLEGTGLDGYTATWQQVKDFSDIYGNDVTNDVKNITNIRAIGLIDQVKGSWGSLSMDSGVATGAQVDIAGNTWLNYAAGNNGFFISNYDHSAALGAKVSSQKTLTLLSGGAIGHITLENGDANVDRNYTTLDIADGDTTIESITASNDNATGTYATRVNVRSNTTITGENGIRDVGEVNVLNGATLTSTQADIQELWVEESTADISGTLTVNGDGTAEGDGEALALGGKIKAGSIVLEDGSELNAAHGGTITTKSVTVANNSDGSTIQVGFDIDTITDIISEEHENSYYTGTGYLEVSDYLDLNGARLVVDPAYDEATSVAAVMNFKNGQDKTYDTVFNDVGIVNGSVLVGKNAALGIGATLAETREAIATYQNNGALDANKYGSILYLNGQLTLDGNSEIALNSDANVKTLDGIRDSLKYTITSQVQDQEADLGLGANTAILMTEAAFENEKGEKTGVAITFDRTNAVVNGQGGDIVLVGAFDAAQKLNFFKDKDGEGHQGAYIAGQDIKVYTQNGFLFTTLEAGTEAGYEETLHVDTDRAFQVMSDASDPVVNTLISYHEDRLPADSNSGNDAGTEVIRP